MNLGRLLVSCLVLALVAACDGPPTSPDPPDPSPREDPPAPGAPSVLPGDTPPTSVLGVTTLEVAPPKTSSYIQYRVALSLTELSGESGAWIRAMQVHAEGGEPEADCAWMPFRIPPGGTWESWRVSYCAPYSFNVTPASQLTVTITYTDDAGRVGSLERVVAVRP